MQNTRAANLCVICVHSWPEEYFLQHDRLSLGHDENLFVDAVSAGGCEQSLRRLVERLKTEAKCSVMHRDQRLSAQFQKSLHRLFWIHVNFARSGEHTC